jgi:NAD(P)-dependent dehydrogenase (short-subunit alcohol dehydrogenase family)
MKGTQPQTVLITGASSGIGLGLAQGFLEQGFRVVANSRRITQSTALTPSANLVLVDGDVADEKTARVMVETAERRFGAIDVLINNAGIFVPKPFTEYTAGEFRQVLDTNLHGFFYLTQQVIRHMKQRGGGQVITITTSLVEQPIAGVNAALTSLTKGGLNAVTRQLAIEHAAAGIRINAIAPGIIDTPMHKPENHEQLRQLHPIARLGTVDEIVEAALFLVRSPFITGEILHVDGGAHAGKW